MTDNYSINKQPYRLDSIVAAEPPPGAEGADWYRYEIVQGTNKLHGYRQGSLESVTIAVEENIELLNERQLGKHRRGHLTSSAK